MATAEGGGATAKTPTTTNTSSYGGGGGVGGKFRKKPFRKHTTPYDRPPVSFGGNDSGASWLTKVVVDPAYRLITYGAHRLFASVFRKRLTRPPPPPPPSPLPPQPQISALDHVSSNGQTEAVPNSQCGVQEPVGGDCSQAITNYSGKSDISELEKLLQLKTFTRSEIAHLTELLHSRAGEVSHRDDGKRNEETSLDFGRSQQFESSLLEANIIERDDRSHGVVSTLIPNSKVLENSTDSPTEVENAYMGSIPSKFSRSMIGENSQVTREDDRLRGNTRAAFKPPSMSLTTKPAVSPGSPVNGFMTAHRSRGRSAIYSMARSPHLSVTPTIKGNGINCNVHAGPTLPSTSLSTLENSERSDSRSVTLKRGSYVLDDEVGSADPIRRIRQKSNLLPSGIPRTNGVGFNSSAMVLSSKQKHTLIGNPEYVPRTVHAIDSNSIPSTSHPQISTKSRDLDSEKSSKAMLLRVRGKPFKLTPSMLGGQALRSMEDVSSTELMLSVVDDHKFENGSTVTSPDTRDSSQEQGKVEENGSVESYITSDTRHPVINNDPLVSLKASGFRNEAADSVVQNGVSQPQYKRAFRMSAPEDYVELDDEDDNPSNGVASPPVVGREQTWGHLTNSKLKLLKTTIQPELKSPSGLISSKTSELKGISLFGEQSSGPTIIPSSEEATVAVQSAVLPVSVAPFGKPDESNNPSAVFSFSSKATDKFPALMPESSSRTPVTKPESSSSLLNIFTLTGPLVKTLEPKNGGYLKPRIAKDQNGNCDTDPSTSSNGPLASNAPIGSFAASSYNKTNQIFASGPAIFTHSTSVSTFAPSTTGEITSATSGSSLIGVANIPTVFGAPPDFKFGASSAPYAEVSAASTMIVPASEVETKDVTNSTAGGVETVSQGLFAQFAQPFSFAPPPSSNKDAMPSSVPSLSGSQVFNPIPPFTFNSSGSSPGTSAVISGNGPTSSTFGVNPTAVAVGSAANPTSVATHSMFSFGLSSSASSNALGSTDGAAPAVFSFGSGSSASAAVTNTISSFSASAVGSSDVSAPPVYSFGANSPFSASVNNTKSSLTNSTSGVFNFGGSSLASSTAINSVNSDPAPANPFGPSLPTPKSSIFGSQQSAGTGFSFGASSASPVFSFATSSASAMPSPTPSLAQSVFGNSTSGFAASPGNNYQMSPEDSMAEDPVQSTAPPSVPMFGQTPVPPPSGFMFGSAQPAQVNPFQFGGQTNQPAPQNPGMFQASGSIEFNGGGSFSLGSGGDDKAGRKFLKANRNRNRRR